MMIRKTYTYLVLVTLVFALGACEEDFPVTTDYEDQTVVYAFLEHKDPWDPSKDTNFVVVNKAFLGETNINDMAAVSDSVNYADYDQVEVRLQRVDRKDVNATLIGESIELKYIRHYKEPGQFATDNNIVFYTTKSLMNYQDVNQNPRPSDEKYYYKLTVLKPNQDEVCAVTEVLRGIYEGDPLTRPESHRFIQMESNIPNRKYEVDFKTNPGARMFQLSLRVYYYEKRTDGNIYIDYIDYHNHPQVSSSKETPLPEDLTATISPSAFYSNFAKQLEDTTGVVWRIIKTKQVGVRPESHAIMITLGTQETFVYNQVSQPSYGIVQQKPSYSNVTNGLGLFTSKWTHKRSGFTVASETIDAISERELTRFLKFKSNHFTSKQNEIMDHASVIKRY